MNHFLGTKRTQDEAYRHVIAGIKDMPLRSLAEAHKAGLSFKFDAIGGQGAYRAATNTINLPESKLLKKDVRGVARPIVRHEMAHFLTGAGEPLSPIQTARYEEWLATYNKRGPFERKMTMKGVLLEKDDLFDPYMGRVYGTKRGIEYPSVAVQNAGDLLSANKDDLVNAGSFWMRDREGALKALEMLAE